MIYRTLGPEGLKVSAIGLGGRRLSDPHTATQNDDSKAQALVDHAIARGVTMIDTADVYADGENEEMFGRILSGGRRQKVVLATKFGFITRPDGKRGVDGRPEYAVACCEASLRRLKTDVIDLYYLHRVDPKVPIEDTMGALARLKDQGKIRHIGISAASAENVRRAAKAHPITALQSEYSLWARGVEPDVLPACRDNGIGFVAYYPLGMGFLAGAIRTADSLGPKDSRRKRAFLRDESIGPHWRRLLELKALADEKGCTLGQLALAWLFAQGRDVVAIPGTSQIPHLDDNLIAADIELGKRDIERIDALYSPGENAIDSN